MKKTNAPTTPAKSRQQAIANTPPPRKKMPAEVFKEIWKSYPITETEVVEAWRDCWAPVNSNTIQFLNIDIEGEIKVRKNSYTWANLVLSNCQLENCFFRNSKFRSITLRDNTTTGDISILENSATDKFEVSNSITGNFQIIDSVTGDIKVHNLPAGFPQIQLSSETKNFRIENSKIGSIDIFENSKVGAFNIKKSDIGYVNVTNAKVDSFRIYENSQTDAFYFGNTAVIGRLEFQYSKGQGFWLSKEVAFGNLSILSSSLQFVSILNSSGELVSIHSSKLSNINIYSSRILRFSLYQSILPCIDITAKSFIGEFTCYLSLQSPCQITLTGSMVRHLNLDNSILPEFATIMASGCEINLLSIEGFCNYGTIFFSNLRKLDEWQDFELNDSRKLIQLENGQYKFIVKKSTISGSTLRLTNSDLGKIQFINCDLRQFQRFEFSNTKMLDVFVAGSQMPSDKAFCLPNGEEDPLKIAEQKRLAYGQFKKIYEARGDVAGSLPYLAYEMEAYRQQLQLEGWWKHRGELFMLWMNKLSTNYGVSWQRGLTVTICVMIFFYSVFCLLLGYVPGTDVSKFIKIASFAPQYLNPFRDADSVIPNNYLPLLDVLGDSYDLDENNNPILPPYARLWDYLSRIFVAYFVYQTIQAFRKLGKSSG